MTRWCTRLAALIGSTMALVYLAAAAASAGPMREPIHPTTGAEILIPPAQPAGIVQSGTPLTGLIVTAAVIALVAAVTVLVIRPIHSHHDGHAHAA